MMFEDTPNTQTAERPGRTRQDWRQRAALFVVFALALWIRLYYVHTAVVDHPLRGDAVQYFNYALNLVHHHVFSMAEVEAGTPPPDSFRDPGYPAFLAGMIAMRGEEQAFYTATLALQATLSALTVLLYAFLARRWLGLRAAVIVGLGLALWPHSITLAGYLLSETLLGFLVALALWLLQAGLGRLGAAGMLASGATFAAAALTNAVMAPAAPLFAALMAWRDKGRRGLWLCLFVAAIAPCAAWMIRGAQLPPGMNSSNRVAMNFVQGSWPEYHKAWIAGVLGNPDARQILGSIDGEITKLNEDRGAGLAAIAARMQHQPVRYLMWYVTKPAELWGWSIGIGQGDIYVYPTYASPLSGSGILRVTTDLLYFANPFLMLLALAGVVVIAATWRRREPALVAAIGIGIYVTCVFTVLQADARYAVPYRGIEWIAISVSILSIATWLKDARRRSRMRTPSHLESRQ